MTLVITQKDEILHVVTTNYLEDYEKKLRGRGEVILQRFRISTDEAVLIKQYLYNSKYCIHQSNGTTERVTEYSKDLLKSDYIDILKSMSN